MHLPGIEEYVRKCMRHDYGRIKQKAKKNSGSWDLIVLMFLIYYAIDCTTVIILIKL